MKTEKIVTNMNEDEIANQKIKESVNELIDLFIQVSIVKSILYLLNNFLENQDIEISEPASVLSLCISQLEYAHRRSSEIMDTILEYGYIRF